MNTKMRLVSVALMAMTLIFASVAHAVDPATWVPAGGPNDWNVDANWVNVDAQNFVPDSEFDVPVIANGGIAFLDAPAIGNDDPFESVTVSNGGLEIRDGGGLNTNLLEVSDVSSLSLSGNSSLTVSGNASTIGSTRIEGPNVDYSVTGSYTVGGSFRSVVTGPQHSAVQVGGAANVSGTLVPEFNGVTPSLGDSWTLIDADSIVGGFGQVDTSSLPPLEAGVIYTAAVDSGAGNINLTVTNTLQLVVDRRTGKTTMENVVGDPIAIDSYTISSPSSLLNPADGGWLSLADSGGLGGGWTEGASSADVITESKAGGPGTIAVGSPVDLGSPYAPTNFAPEDMQLSFSAAGITLPGLVKYEGVPFNLVLNVEPDTGTAEITNQATVPIEFDGYAIRSASGALQSADASWSSLEDSGAGGGGWREANPTANALAELNPGSTTTLGPNQSLSLGTIFDTSKDADLSFQFFLAGGSPDLRDGFVAYGLAPTQAFLEADFNQDGIVNFTDFLVLSTQFNQTVDPPGTPPDINGDGVVNFPDFLVLSTQFNMTSGDALPVPEPSAASLMGICVLCLATLRRRRHA